MDVNEYLQEKKEIVSTPNGFIFRKNAPAIVCKDGLRLSVQVSSGHYCTPRVNDADYYSHVEVGYPSEVIPELLPYAEDKDYPCATVYPQVPVGLVDDIIAKHGGIRRKPGQNARWHE